jgi:ABC-type lipoprotein release transport system permease subunit
MYNHTTFLITAAIMITAVVTVALYSMSVANAQSTNMTKNITGSSKTMNMTAGGGNITKSTHHKTREIITRAPGM